jgi:hypothetical protein
MYQIIFVSHQVGLFPIGGIWLAKEHIVAQYPRKGQGNCRFLRAAVGWFLLERSQHRKKGTFHGAG